MSLQENTGLVVCTTFLVGPWPAGPPRLYNNPLHPVDVAASQGSIFHRRAARPGNAFQARPRQATFLPPIHIPNSPLDITFPSSPHRAPGRSRTRRANPGGSPLQPPASLLGCLPNFPACNASNCGRADRIDYHMNGETAEDGLDLGYVDITGAPGRGEWARCHLCDDLELRRMMHRMPCGHILCGYHLTRIATRAVDAATNNPDPVARRAIREASGELGRLRRDLVPGETMPNLRASQERRMARYRGELLDLLGLSCCGVDMHLVEDWILCLDEWLARKLWAVTWGLFRGEGQEGTMFCGWPDCRAAIPRWCSYETGGRPSKRWYCVACEGNSIMHRQGLWPAR